MLFVLLCMHRALLRTEPDGTQGLLRLHTDRTNANAGIGYVFS